MKRVKRYLTAVSALLLLGLVCAAGAAVYVSGRWSGTEAWVYLPQGSDAHAVRDSLASKTTPGYARRVMAAYRGGNARGAYLVRPGDKAWQTARRIRQGRQTPVRVTFNNLRTFDDLCRRIAAQMEFSPEAFAAGADSVFKDGGFRPAEYVAAVLPDTYEFYWTDSPANVASTLLAHRNRFWDDGRRGKAKALGLTPVQAAVIASIAEEESNNRAERPVIARLYLNRFRRGMKLQADPTVKFALGDFSLRRIRHGHLQADSPYNTYLYEGLPPGPIRIVEAATIDALLDSKPHDYFYMCAKADFSGTHEFARDHAAHQANARRYQAALDKRKL